MQRSSSEGEATCAVQTRISYAAEASRDKAEEAKDEPTERIMT